MGRVYLVSQTPGLVSFGKKREEEKKGIYHFPLIEDSGHQFRRQNEVGTRVTNSFSHLLVQLFVLGKTGPSTSIRGDSSVRVHCYYTCLVEVPSTRQV